MHMVMFVLDDPNHLDDVLAAWENLGVSGITIIESTGISRHWQSRMAGQPFMAGINRLMHSDYEGHFTLFTIVKGEEAVRNCITAAEAIVGNLNEPKTGVIAAWRVEITKGVPDPELNTEAD